jgi:FtsH-binding integral membrane protein
VTDTRRRASRRRVWRLLAPGLVLAGLVIALAAHLAAVVAVLVFLIILSLLPSGHARQRQQ